MALSGKDVREVSFTYRHRGYSMDAVDEFLDHVADRLEELERQVEAAQTKARQAEDRLAGKGGDDIIQRTLVHAQRTADDVVATAKASADEIVNEARTKAQHLLDAGQAELVATLKRLESQKDQLTIQVRELESHVEVERKRAIEFHTSSLEWLSSVTPAQGGDSHPDTSPAKGASADSSSEAEGDEKSEDPIKAGAATPYDADADMDVTRAVPVVKLDGGPSATGADKAGADKSAADKSQPLNAPYDVDADSDTTQAVSVVRLDDEDDDGDDSSNAGKKGSSEGAGSGVDEPTQAIRLR